MDNKDEVLHMLNTYNKDAAEGEMWYDEVLGAGNVNSHDAVAVYNGAKWVEIEPLKLTDLKDVSIPDANDELLLFDVADNLPNNDALMCFTEVMEDLDLTNYITITGHGNEMVKIDITTGEVEFGECFDLNETARVFWEAIASVSPWKNQKIEHNENLELERQYTAMAQSFEDDIKGITDPFEDAKGVL